MQSFSDLARALNRPPVYLRGLQARFALPVITGANYSDAYAALLRSVIYFRILGVSENALVRLWEVEKKLLTLLNVDSTGSATWFLDACGQTSHRNRRLLLSNYDMGAPITSHMLQPGLNFRASMPELFASKEMGEDALRVFEKYLKALAAIHRDVSDELPQLRAALKRGKSLGAAARVVQN
jgi:hypothetical protein